MLLALKCQQNRRVPADYNAKTMPNIINDYHTSFSLNSFTVKTKKSQALTV